jgi:hypothetical protein
MTSDNKFVILKLSSGEEVVCGLIQKNEKSISVSTPLKLMTIPRRTSEGIEESLSLSRWMHFAEGNSLEIQENQILASAPASYGLSKFYEYCIFKMNKQDEEYNHLASSAYSEENFMDDMEEDIDEEEFDFDDYDHPTKTYH